MCKIWDKITGKNSSTANITYGKLVISTPDSIEPSIWTTDLEQITSSAFKTKSEENGNYSLIIEKIEKTENKGKETNKTITEIIATYDNKELAIAALMNTSKALKSSPSEINLLLEKGKQHPSNKSEAKQWLIALLAAALLIGMFMYLGKLAPNTMNYQNQQTLNSQSSGAGSTTGVPVDADKMLEGF
jgi:hypothetical protein